ncbi:PQQ-binding-like beta-propeller repeat protein [Phytomonospora sp. NPDC050363]|uniref:outer membrane protein assembly factor BamB family protein n=1 Tax=Phytomonospora sp. NPDC050363 TaxID=3155642 RepID=UPI0033C56035
MRSAPRTSRLLALAVGAVLSLTACAQPVGRVLPPDEWVLEVPEQYGPPVASRIAGETVLVTTGFGLLGLDRATGAEKWWRDYRQDFTDTYDTGLSRGLAMFRLTVAGDAVVVTKSPETTPGGTERPGHEVLDLATGETRFTVQPKTDAAVGWSLAHVTPTAIVGFECVDGEACAVTSYPLTGAAPTWTAELPGGRVSLPEQLTWRQERNYASDINAPPDWRVTESAAIALVEDLGDDTATTLDLNTGRTLGTWPRAETRAWYQVVGPTVVEVGEVLRGLDPASGRELWRHELLDEATSFGFHGFPMVDGDLVDETEAAHGDRGYQFIDLAAGPQGVPRTAPPGKALVIDPRVVVTVDQSLALITASDPASRAATWTAELEQDGTIGLFESLVDDGNLIVTGTRGYDEPGAVWVVDMDDGKVEAFPGEAASGYEDGLLVTVAGDEIEGFVLRGRWI